MKKNTVKKKTENKKWEKPKISDLFPQGGENNLATVYLACSCICGTYVGGKTITGM